MTSAVACLQASDQECAHCGLPVPQALHAAGAEAQFCCGGCRVAHSLLAAHGLESFYEVQARLGSERRPVRARGASHAELDDPAFAELYCRPTGEGCLQVELLLEGVHCAACVWLVERLPRAVPGVASARLDLGRSVATVTWDPEAVSLSRVARFLDAVGYPPHPYRGVATREVERREERAQLLRLGVAGAVAGNVMLLAFALYGGAFHGISDEYRDLLRWTSVVVSLPAVLWCALPFYRGALGALRTRTLHMDVPIALGVLAGSAWGVWSTVSRRGEVYFDSVTVLIFLLLVGRELQRRQQRRAARATELLFALVPRTARVAGEDGLREISLEAVRPGMTVEVRAGETVPADGQVTAGTAAIDRSLLTGESRPEVVRVGDPVHAGTVALDGRLRVHARATGEATRIGQLLRMVEEGARRRAPVVLLADRIAGWFVGAVLALAAVTLGLWLVLDPGRAVDHAVALLIVSCPCALALATPLAVTAAVGQAARAGVLIKGGDVLERLALPGRMVLDKTGTLTDGRLSLQRWYGDHAARMLVARVESASAHPIARALTGAGAGGGERDVMEVREVAGRGLEAFADGHCVVVGSPEHVGEAVGGLPEEWSARVGEVSADGLTPVVAAVDGVVRAVAGLGDRLRAEARATISALGDLGWQVELLSGDHPEVVTRVGRAAGLSAEDCRGGTSPEAKVERVQQARGSGAVVMVGDGVNDAAALAAADVGVAVHGGAEAAMVAADVFVARPGVAALVELVQGAQRTLGVIRRNLVFSLAYNAVVISLAMAGWMHPVVAAVLMPASSILVVLSSYRTRAFTAPDTGQAPAAVAVAQAG